MKRIIKLSLICLLVCVLLVSLCACADSNINTVDDTDNTSEQSMNTGFSTESLSEDDIDTILKNRNISMLAEEPQRRTIDCFDVNENGLIAIGCSDHDNKTVCIYTNDGDFQYGYSFECYGSFGVELDDNILMIYFVRSDVAISINPMGEVESVLEIQNTIENNSYWNDSVYLNEREVGGNTYTIKNDMGFFNIFASSYSQLIITNINGEERLIYDVNSAQLKHTLVIFIYVLVFICFAVVNIIKLFIKLNRDPSTSQSH